MYQKLSTRDKKRTERALEIFIADPMNKDLRNHSVSPKYPWWRSIDASFDLRIIYTKDKNNHVILIKVWTHSELYG